MEKEEKIYGFKIDIGLPYSVTMAFKATKKPTLKQVERYFKKHILPTITQDNK